MKEDAIIRAEALVRKLGDLKDGLDIAANEYEHAAQVALRPGSSGDEEVNAEKKRHAEALLVMYRKKLEAALAFVEKELR